MREYNLAAAVDALVIFDGLSYVDAFDVVIDATENGESEAVPGVTVIYDALVGSYSIWED
jgi:hypothetical protein